MDQLRHTNVRTLMYVRSESRHDS